MTTIALYKGFGILPAQSTAMDCLCLYEVSPNEYV
jgi:hypothetical protein